jgi:hypothetical protein
MSPEVGRIGEHSACDIVCFSFNSVLSRTQRGCGVQAEALPPPAPPGPFVLLDPFPVCARFRLAAAARAGGADHEANEVTE